MTQKTMRSPRRINFSHEALKNLTWNDKPPPSDSISWKLWQACQDIAQAALNTDYIQGIANGNLNPNNYGQYTIQDSVYCYNAQNDYLTIEKRANSENFPELAAFAKARYESYVSYTKETFSNWHIKEPSALSPSQAAQTYIDFEHLAATDYSPIYGVVAMIPCDQLWPWLATQLKSKVSATNLYSFWITENEDWSGAYRLDNFIDAWFAKHPNIYSWNDALYIYQSCMTCELNFFKSACGQALSSMPNKLS